ncbi:MAG: nucleotide sugar dehydrogenase [Acidobacteriota bacterium]
MLESVEGTTDQHAQIYYSLLGRILARKASLGVIGLGYVGLPEAAEFARAGFSVIGFDIDARRIEQLNQGTSYIQDISDDQIKPLLLEKRLQATTDFARISELDTINICVPTPLRKSKDPDLSYIIAAVDQIKKYLRRGQLVILESTTYPGTTEEILLPIFSEKGFKVGEDFFLAFSPERIDPGNSTYNTHNIPKVVGGVTPRCTELAASLYRQAVERVETVSSPAVAEMVKLLENTFRSVNIGLVNEIALMCHKLGLNVWEVIQVAATKPFGFMPFYPGPGVGGHCIPLDPFYLSWKARMHGFEPRFIDLAGQINAQMPVFVVSLIANGLNDHQKCLRNARVHILGVAYKRDIGDVRESPALEVMRLLINKGTIVSYSDPYVPTLQIGEVTLRSIEPTADLLRRSDCVAVITDHSAFNYSNIATYAPLIIDTRNAMGNIDSTKIIRL